MIIQIKQALLEGYTLETIVEAIHANHKYLDKRRLKDPKTSYAEGKEIEKNRKKLRDEIKDPRSYREEARKSAAALKESDPEAARKKTKDANLYDNVARARSQNGGRDPEHTAELHNIKLSKIPRVLESTPRLISSAKK